MRAHELTLLTDHNTGKSNYKLNKTRLSLATHYPNATWRYYSHDMWPVPSICPRYQVCGATCIKDAGNNSYPYAIACKKRRTEYHLARPNGYRLGLSGDLDRIEWEIERDTTEGRRVMAAVRLNTYSDIDWTGLASAYPLIQFYDYSKVIERTLPSVFTPNYHITFSHWPTAEGLSVSVLERGGTVAVVYPAGMDCPSSWWDYPCIDGDEHDARWLDAPGHVVALKAKGRARQSTIDNPGVVEFGGWQ